MYWKTILLPDNTGAQAQQCPDGRFVLHRHNDEEGTHLDLRLECGDVLLGWRVAGEVFAGEPWATEKMPHPLHWLDQDGHAIREDAGLYHWIERTEDSRTVLLRGRQEDRLVRFERVRGIAPEIARAICAVLQETQVNEREAARLIADGVTARQRAVARLCGLGKELDGTAFDEAVWRKSLQNLTLDEIHDLLRLFEVRFDLAYPPAPVAIPETLVSSEEGAHLERGLNILRSTEE
ncbi:MAG TPA: hypothetical protein PKY35_05030 [Candidatus Hydrogenedentes bacterium]|nr:hypothetical protein [Candidatus Hydrogenedentota bacterium]HOL76374.1 hypothetical protein [Candidatus Hydrogenedentota bacterium]HPO85412.1 hypothetical protein [Candidatus Hydrogenedentota bacterium]